MADDIIIPEEKQDVYVSPFEDVLREEQQNLDQQQKDDEERIKQLAKGRAYWAGANMFANALGNLINVYGTTHGAPAMKMPDMDNSYMKLWKESDDLRKANYQRMKDRYDRLRLAKIQDEASWNRELDRRDWQERQTKETRTYNERQTEAERRRKEQEKDEVRNRSIEQVKALHPDWTDIQAEAYVDQKLISDDYRRKLAKEEEDRRIREYNGRENAKQKAKVFYSGTGKDENNLYVSDGIGEDIIITGKDRSDKKKNIGLVSAIIKEKLDEMFPEVTYSDIAKERNESKKEELKKMKDAYDTFVASNKKTDWTNLDERDIQYYIKKYNLLDEDLRHQLRQIAKSDVSERKNMATSDYIYPRVKTMEEIYRENRSSGNEHTDKPKIIY